MIDIAAGRRGERASLWAASAGLATLHSKSHVACRCSRKRSWQSPGVHPVTSTLVRLTKILQHQAIPINYGAEKLPYTHRRHACSCKVRASGACGHRLPGSHCRGSRTSGLLRRLLQRCVVLMSLICRHTLSLIARRAVLLSGFPRVWQLLEYLRRCHCRAECVGRDVKKRCNETYAVLDPARWCTVSGRFGRMNRHAERVVCDQIIGHPISLQSSGIRHNQSRPRGSLRLSDDRLKVPLYHMAEGCRAVAALRTLKYSWPCAGYRGWNWGRGDYYCQGRESFPPEPWQKYELFWFGCHCTLTISTILTPAGSFVLPTTSTTNARQQWCNKCYKETRSVCAMSITF